MLLYKKVTFQFILFACSVGYFLSAILLGKPVTEEGIQPSFFPHILGAASVVFSAILLWREAAKVRLEKQSLSTASADTHAQYSAFLIIVAIFFYIIAFAFIGYFISSVFFVYALILIFSEKEKWLPKFFISIVIVGLGYLVFEQMFGVRLPAIWE